MAERVLSQSKTKPLPNPKKLREKAERASDPRAKRTLLLEAERAEKKRNEIERRMAGPKAEAQARLALQAAKWRAR